LPAYKIRWKVPPPSRWPHLKEYRDDVFLGLLGTESELEGGDQLPSDARPTPLIVSCRRVDRHGSEVKREIPYRKPGSHRPQASLDRAHQRQR